MAPRSLLIGLAVAALSLFTPSASAFKEKPSPFSFSSAPGGYQLGGPNLAPEIRVAPNDAPGVLRAAKDLAADFGKVLGVNGTVVVAEWSATITQTGATRPMIFVGTVGKSSLVDNLVSSQKLDVAPIAGKWESYLYKVVSTPWAGRDGVLVIAGSDSRGAVFGIYDIAERIGVSPWHYWADIVPTKRQYIWASIENTHQEGPPSIKYRGIFLNDEAPALTGWGKSNFKTSQYGSAFVSDFYRHIFDLVLRLKGNYVWPAMWSSMFYLDDPKNGPLATEYGIFMGTSHHEPMARADKEQGRFLKGSWDWKSNKAGVQTFMQEGPARAKNWSTIYTLGMRGSGDAASATLSSSALEEIIAWQQGALTKAIGKPISEIPQVWVMYKCLGDWQAGMRVSDDVTLLWSDDNRGNIRRIPIGNEEKRRGGSGMYYHFDYVGDPRNYKWINTIQLQKTWEQMTLTHDSGVKNIWIANVGDLKALELPTAHYMAIAWDRDSFDTPDSTRQWLKFWSGRQFGEAVADEAASIMTTYGKLTARHKYEDLSRTPFAFHDNNYDEVELNYKEWTDLLARAQKAHDSLPTAVQDSFFEIVLHPVLAGKTVFEIYSKVALGSRYATEKRISANKLAKDVQAAFSADQAITKRFHSIKNGKWNHFMDQTHIGYNNWQEPSSNSLPKLTTITAAASNAIMGVSAQGSTAAFPGSAKLTMAPLSAFGPPGVDRYFDVFARADGTFSYEITSDSACLNITNRRGTVSAPNDVRAILTVDWAAVPAGTSTATLTITNLNQTSVKATVVVPLEKPALPAEFKGHVEADKVVSIEAEHFSQADSSKEHVIIPDYGRTLSGVRLPPRTPSQPAGKGFVLAYPFYTFTEAADASVVVYLAPSENANPNAPNKYSVAVDGGAATTVQVVPTTNGASQPAGWADAVVRGSYVKTSKVGRLAAGRHVLRVWLLEPTMVVTKVVVDVGGVKTSLMGPPESWVVK